MKPRIVILAATLVIATVTLAGCSSQSVPNQWLHSTSTSAVYVSWTDKNGTISGTVEESLLGRTGNALLADNQKEKFVGTIAKGKVILHLAGADADTENGTVTTKRLVIEGVTNSTFSPGTLQQYTDAVAKLKKTAAAH